ncbi:flavodoxin domain-containing protein [Raineyella sp. LH-20]|uniref:flavodoxin domain-containing protein n=1 Tax=Raineyella sp. LH-20 TaxID=3081204 RepID=UPI002953D04F|nr:flavodoxin domain-containing protein [Raineyella sp. LH-20]WOP19718.1 flavodoxin domain-containing protein [Raineyella sp. LH-20]
MKVLVAYATRHGATAGIASRIAETLTAAGHQATASPVDQVTTLDDYAAVVLGSAAYMYHWLKPAVQFARRHRGALAERPLWLFSSGPVGATTVDDAGRTVDDKGRDVFEGSRPKEFEDLSALHPRGDRVFFGAYDPDADPVGFGERMLKRMPAAKDSLPAGDFRDWQAIEEWAREIAASLDAMPAD